MPNLWPSLVPTGLLAALLIWVVNHPNQTQIYLALICRLMARFWKTAARSSVSKDIQGRIGLAAKLVNGAAAELLPRDLRIDWVETVEPDAFRQKDQVIIRMRDYGNQARNMAVATVSYVAAGLLPEARQYLDRQTSASMDMTVSRRILIEQSPGSLPFFHGHYVQPILDKDSQIKPLLEAMFSLDERGLFTSIFLTQLKDLVAHIWPHTAPAREIEDEIRSFLGFLRDIARKERHIDVPLSFSGKKMKVGVVLVGNFETLTDQGLDPYERAYDFHVGRGAKAVYMCAFGGKRQIAPTMT